MVAGAVLVLLALAGRRPPAGPAGEPARPAAAPAVLGGLLLVVVALETAGWQVYDIRKYGGPDYPPHLYRHLLTGETTLSSMLSAPFAYAAWLTAALTVLGAVLAFRRAPAARPLGMALGVLTLLDGVVDLCSWHAEHALFKGGMPDAVLTEQGFAVFHVVAGLLLAVFLAQRGAAPAAPPSGPGWTPQPPPAWQAGSRTPVWGPPYQQPQVPPGYQVPHQAPGSGAFGPPSELPPNLPPGTPPPPAGPPSVPPGSAGSPGSSGPSTPKHDRPSGSRQRSRQCEGSSPGRRLRAARAPA
ncbi:hypothetical protein [Actinacidiphila acidipaludis]|uniref:Uncharacterized protein n=1 Tax=Actinacidiphila acidipaludis TaxID=2873382 RepID=A0ABS7Q1N8_9ACTN|nr:hypothetical protein [Streptomyces acidipaludis]MBY8877047.1 hypothetical protein [Streptomyces acidipaludis]